jgi:hypothetical protein
LISVRPATADDIADIADMAVPFIAYSDYGPFVNPTKQDMEAVLLKMIDTGIVLGAFDEGKAVGVIVAVMTHPWLSPSTRVAAEMAWWVNEEYRGGRTAFLLLKAFEDWAKSNQADVIALSDLVINGDTPIGKMVAKLGYTLVERSHVKRA